MNPKIMRICSFGVLLIVLFAASFVCAQAGSAAGTASSRNLHLTISTTQSWIDTGIDLQAGDVLNITANAAPSSAVPDRHAIGGLSAGCDPQGVSGASASNLPVPDALPGALIAKFQVEGIAVLVGAGKELRISEPGHLFLGVNANGAPSCVGAISIAVHIAPAAATSSVSANSISSTNQPAAAQAQQTPTQPQDVRSKLKAAAKIWWSGQVGNDSSQQAAAATPGMTSATPATTASSATTSNATAASAVPALTVSATPLDSSFRKSIDGLPRRINDKYENQGDMVNFMLVGNQEQVQRALEAANWHVADTDNKEAGLKAVLQTIEKKDYLQMPMSQLYLFGRVQDFGYEQAEPYAMVASRHHFRIWKAPFTWNGQTVWAGAGTHDIGFERDQRNGSITHKIDPAVDGERDNIGASLQKAEQVSSLNYYLPPSPVQDAKNATGGGYHSDGRVLVIFLK